MFKVYRQPRYADTQLIILLFFSGRPLPPTGLNISGYLGNYSNYIRLSWEPARTLFDKTDDDNIQSRESLIENPRPHYVVYVYLESDIGNSFLLYRNETATLSKTIRVRDLNLTSACNLSANISFYVSAKFDEVGEGNKSSPIRIKHICKEGKVSVIYCGCLFSTLITMLGNGGLRKSNDGECIYIYTYMC